MPFSPPGFSALSINTHNLEEQFSIFLGRYKVVASPTDNTTASTLARLITRTQDIICECDTNRTSQRDVFTQLTNELAHVLKEKNEDEMREATLILLGALLHRYFRLLKSTDNTNSYTYFSFFKIYEPKSCRLFLAIREALGLEKIDDEYRTKDLAAIDVVTVVTSLEAFRNHMFDSDTDPRYKKYPHFAPDAHFKPYLDEIINEHKMRGAQLLSQFKAIHFIQSLGKQIIDEHHLLTKTLQGCAASFAEDHPDFNALNLDVLNTWVEQKIKSSFYKKLIINLIDASWYKKELESLKQSNETNENKYSGLFEAIETCYLGAARFILSGSYALVFESISAQDNKEVKGLRFCIYNALGLDNSSTDLVDEDIKTCLRFLNDFIDERPSITLNTDFFGSHDKMKTVLMKSRAAVNERISNAPHANNSLTV